MKPRSNPFLRSLALASSILLNLGSSAFANQYQWGGATSTDWATAANWSTGTNITAGPGPIGGSYAHRLNVYNDAGNKLLYTASLGTTTYGNTNTTTAGGGGRGLVIGSGINGELEITGGTFSTLGSASPDIIGNGDGKTGSLIVSGGTFIGTNANTWMNIGGSATSGRVSNLTISGTGTAKLASLVLNGVTINVNLDGGTLELNGFTNTSIAAASKIRLNGGTLKARQNNAGFIAANANLQTLVKSGGAVIDTNGFDITIDEPLLEDPGSPGGGLTKNGTGLLTLTRPSTTTGATTINGGGLALKADISSWSPSAFAHAGDTLNFDLGVYNVSNPTVLNTGALTVSSAVTVNVTGSNFQVGQIPLIHYTSKSITGSLTLNTSSLPTGVIATLVDDNAGQIYLDVTQAATTFDWSGDTFSDATGDWDTSSLNWNSNTTAYSTATDQIANFPDIAGGGTVNIIGSYSPLVVNISNIASTNPYTFSGSGKITGTTALNKSNAGYVIFTNDNDYSGVTTISGGALIKQAADSTTGNINVTSDNISFVLDGINGSVADGSGQTLFLAGRGITTANYFYSGSTVQRGALQSQNGANTWQGDIVLTSNSATNFNRIGVQNGASLTLTGNITENVAGAYLLFRAGNTGDDITLGGTGTYSYTSETQMFSNGGAIILGNNNKLPTGNLLNLTSGGTTVFDMNGHNQETAGIYGGAIGLMATITNNGSGPSVLTTSPPVGIGVTCNAFITDDGTHSVSIVKNGAGSQILGYANTYSGTTTVNAGILSINGDQSGATGDVRVNGGSLGGGGIIGGAVSVGPLGTLNPAFVVTAGATGTLIVDSADFSDGGTLTIDINDANLQQADLLSVNNSLNVTNGKLVINVTGVLAESSYTLASATTITGTISPGDVTGLPAGYTLVQDGAVIRLDKVAGSPYETWGSTYGLTAGSEGGDLDNDGLTNFQEFAFGLVPNDGSSVNPVTVHLDKTTGQFTYQRLNGSGLTYTIWTSQDMVTWTEDAAAVQTPGTPNGNNVQAVAVTLSGAPLTSSKFFVRVKAE